MNIRERAVLEAIRKVLSEPAPRCAWAWATTPRWSLSGTGELVLTVDSMVEGTHFDRSNATAREIGYRAVVVALSDLAAMAASPRSALVA